MKSLNEVAKELNTVMGLEPPIKTVGVKKETLLEKVKEAAEYIDPEQDEFTKETTEALKELGLWPGAEKPEAPEEEEEKVLPKKGKGSSKPKPEPEPEPEIPEEEDDDPEPEIAVDPKPKKDKAPKKSKVSGEPNQTQLIRDAIKAKKTKDQIIKILETKLSKTESWSKMRFGLYEKAYGEMGKSDKNLK
jgi:hypothetical protein